MSRELLQQALDALTLAIVSHGRLLMSDPPQDAWKFYRVDQRCDDAIKALEAELAKPVNEFNPDWDQQAVLVERIRELEAELAKSEQDTYCKHCDGKGCLACDARCLPEQELAYFTTSNGYVLPNNSIPRSELMPRKEWVGLTDEEIKGILDCGRGGLVDIKKAEQILKDKNT